MVALTPPTTPTSDGGSTGSSTPSGAPAGLAMLAELTAEIARAPDVDRIAEALARGAKWIVPNGRCTVLVLDPAVQEWRLYPGEARGHRGDLTGPIDLALRRGMSVVLQDAPAREADLDAATGAFLPTARSLMVLPLECGGDPFGTLNFSSAQPDVYAPHMSAIPALLQLNVAAVLQAALNLRQAHQVGELKTRLLATVSHDYKNPLTTIAGFCELLLEREYDREMEHRLLSMIRDEAWRLSRLVTDVLDLSRASIETTSMAREPIDLPALVRYCLSTYSVDADPNAAHTFHLDVQPELPELWGDPARITQVLLNVIGNAVKYSPDGGEIHIDVRSVPSRREVTVAITDQGIGIAPESQHMLFQPFGRAKEAIASGIEGTGLGLVISREIAEAHDGRLWAESAGQGHGSTVTLALPFRGTDRSSRTPSSRTPRPGQPATERASSEWGGPNRSG